MDFTLMIWRQHSFQTEGKFVRYDVTEINPSASFLEMIDILNEDLLKRGEEPVAFGHDCREGICGSCSMTINGRPHGPKRMTTACQLAMRSFENKETIYVEPWRATAFPVIKDLVTDRAGLDKIQRAGAYVSVNTGSAPEANSIPVEKEKADEAFEAAACIGCGACVAACPNGSAMLFTAAKVSQYALLPQGQPERYARVLHMLQAQDAADFGGCTNHGECQEACPKGIGIKYITQLNRDFVSATISKLTSLKGKIVAQ